MNFTKDELYWIERTADIECARALLNFTNLLNTPKDKISKEETELLSKYTVELIDLYSMLKELRFKLEAERNEK
jgi:hypothetical protein